MENKKTVPLVPKKQGRMRYTKKLHGLAVMQNLVIGAWKERGSIPFSFAAACRVVVA